MPKVFVYGTLKKGEPNHYWLEDANNGTQKFIGEGRTEKEYPLVIATKYNIPFLLDAPGKGYKVKGEIYEVDDKMLSRLDVLEDHPAFYVRRQEKITCDAQEFECWTYFLPKFKDELLGKNKLEFYSNSDSLPYLERYLREPSYDLKAEIR